MSNTTSYTEDFTQVESRNDIIICTEMTHRLRFRIKTQERRAGASSIATAHELRRGRESVRFLVHTSTRFYTRDFQDQAKLHRLALQMQISLLNLCRITMWFKFHIDIKQKLCEFSWVFLLNSSDDALTEIYCRYFEQISVRSVINITERL